MKRILLIFFVTVIVLSSFAIVGLYNFIAIAPPKVPDLDTADFQVVKKNDSLWVCNHSWLHHSRTGLYEMFIEGEAYQRGLIAGKLSKAQIYKQEAAFVDQIHKMVPSNNYLRLLRLLLYIFNRNIDHYIKPEFLQEIYGLSQSASDDFDDIGSKFKRILNYHAAHDIGHMLQNYNLVGCTSFASWNDKSADSGLIIGRNFDFYVGDKFAEDKIVSFVKPDSGYNFMMITWGGMTGVVSGMNDQGLSVTINSAKSFIPVHIATPISLISRHILQYAKNFTEAKKIADSYNTFVSESLLIGSAVDKKAFIIEKSPYKSDVMAADSCYLICTNHFQSDTFKNDQQNLMQQKETPTLYRFNRTKQLVHQQFPLDEYSTLTILRNPYGMNGEKIGNTNEMAVNQYIAHHSIIFKPAKLQIWISTSPYQLGEFVCYDLNKVFSGEKSPLKSREIYENSLSLPPDWNLVRDYYCSVPGYKILREILLEKIYHTSTTIDESLLNRFIRSNPDYFQVYSLVGEYYFIFGEYQKALTYFNQASGKQIPFYSEQHTIKSRIEDCRMILSKLTVSN
jgi:isopenicillin-N N-acyltransferase like protein